MEYPGSHRLSYHRRRIRRLYRQHCKNEAVDNFIKNVGEAYKEKFGYEAEFYVVDIGVGASRLDV